MDYYKARLKKLFASGNHEAILLVNNGSKNSNFTYMTGLSGSLFEGSILILEPDRAVLLVNVLTDESSIERVDGSIGVRRFRSVKEAKSIIQRHTKGIILGFDGSALPFNSHSRVRKVALPKAMKDVSRLFGEARSVKDSVEIGNIKTAAGIAKSAIEEVGGKLNPGITELEVCREFESIIREQGSEPSFDTIACFGSNSAIPHHMSGRTKLRPNSFVLIDAGALHNGYCSDITRTLIFRPERRSTGYRKMQDMYDTVKEAQARALAAARPGVPGELAHKAAESYINSYGNGRYKGRFIHSLGHSIGIDVHDSDTWALAPGCKGRIKEGMVFSDEPGIYVEGFGGVRIEDDIVITGKGARML